MVDQIRNTTEDLRDATNAAMFLLEQLDKPDGEPGAIERMEAAGQHQLVNSDRLPTKVQGEGDGPFLALGFTFGEPDPRDPIFRPATLPPGWSRQPTDHSMWSKLVDEFGRTRVEIFYKAAFYDRSAFMRLNSPYNYLWSALYSTDQMPVLDDQWLTAEVARPNLEEIARREDKEAANSDRYAETDSDPTYWQGQAAEGRARAAKARQWAEVLP